MLACRPVPADLKSIADEIARVAAEAEREGDSLWAMRCYRWAWQVRAAADQRGEGLTAGRGARKVNSELPMLSTDHKIALSASRSPGNKFLRWIRQPSTRPKEYQGLPAFTMGSLAAAVPMSKSALSQARLKHTDPNHRTIPEAKRKRIHELCGWPVSDW